MYYKQIFFLVKLDILAILKSLPKIPRKRFQAKEIVGFFNSQPQILTRFSEKSRSESKFGAFHEK
jgi:hypothetical protein